MELLSTRSRNPAGRDEMNLVEIPFTSISYSVPQGLKTLEYRDVLNYQGKRIERHSVITGSDKYGLPLASDEEVYIALLKKTKDQNFENRRIHFAPRDLIQTMRWPMKGHSYEKIEQALLRLTGVLLFTNAFWDHASRKFVKRMFHILESGQIVSEKRGRKPQHTFPIDQEPQTFIVWSEEIFESFQAGFIKVLDTEVYFSLTSPISRRLYRLTDKWFYHKRRLEVDLFRLAHEKIGLSRGFIYPSKVREKIQPALEEHVRLGVLLNFEFEESKQDGRWKLILTAPVSRTRQRLDEEDPFETPALPATTKSGEVKIDSRCRQLQKSLQKEVGLSVVQIESYLEQSEDLTEYYLDYFRFEIRRRELIGARPLQNPAGWFKKAFEERWVPPPAFQATQEWKEDEPVKEPCQVEAVDPPDNAYTTYEAFVEAIVDRFIQDLGPLEREMRLHELKEVLFRDTPVARRWKPDVLKETLGRHMRRAVKAELGPGIPPFQQWWEQVGKRRFEDH